MSTTSSSETRIAGAATPSWSEAQHAFARIGLLSFGGPAAQIALMHKVLVDEKRWLDEKEYLGALSFCMLLPGPEAMQLATYAGWKLHGVRGGLMAGLWFVMPGALVVLALSAIYAAFGGVPLVEAVFFGITAAVLVIVIEALLRVAKKALKEPQHWLIAGLAFLAIFFFDISFPVIVLAAALWGYLMARSTAADPGRAAIASVKPSQTAKTVALWLAAWAAPFIPLALIFGRDHLLMQMGWFFSKLAVVTFGGAYAVLAYMGQDVVNSKQWLSAAEMMTGLGLAETTPGPLILVTEFVGFLAAYKQGGWGIGLLGALVALWATFVPCFLWIFAGAPYLAWITAQPRLKGALAAITAAVVGVILNLSVWFALHVIFKQVAVHEQGWLKLWTPVWATFDWRVLVLAAVSGVLLLVRHWNIVAVLAVSAGLALVMSLAG